MNPNDATPAAEAVNPTAEAVSTPETNEVAPTAISPKMLAANRRNALKSTGPRTLPGKSASRMNAVRHGILSSEVVVRGLRIQERADEFKALRERCWESLAPVGPVEEMLVDKIVTAQWRMRRALTAETGEIVLSVDGGRRDRTNRDPVPLWIFMDPTKDAAQAMTKTCGGLEYLKRILEKVDEDVKRDGELTEKTLDWVRGRFMNAPNAMTRELEEYRARFLANPDGLGPEDLKERHQTAVAWYVEGTLGWQAELSRQWKDRENKEETAQQAADVLPSAEVLGKIMRYEGGLDRQLYRAMNQLERLQRRREGEKVSAPLMMDVMK